MNREPSCTIAAPSFVWPARVGDNCRRLEGMVDEVAIIFFETEACLEYTEEDLPSDLPRLNLSYHVHLPLDLPWDRGPGEVHRLAQALAAKTDFLRPRGFVLHPPGDQADLDAFLRLWSDSRKAEDLFIENIKGNDLRGAWPVIREWGCRVCLDLGHLLAFGQESLLELPGLMDRTTMLHLYGPGPEGEHDSLARLDDHGFRLTQRVFRDLPASSTVVLEIFHPEKLSESLDILQSWFRNKRLICGG